MSETVSDILLDRHNRRHTYLRISLTERCNLRCVYCMPEEGVPLKPRKEILTFEEVVRLVRIFVSVGVRKIRLTGGEPLVRKDAMELIRRIGQVEGIEELAITTNGLLLVGRVGELRDAGVTQLNISLDTLRPDRFETIARRRGLDKVLAVIAEAEEVGYDPVKVNCVVMRNVNEDEIVDFVEIGRERAIESRFIEFMPFDGNRWSGDALVSYEEMLGTVRSSYPDLEQLEDPASSTSRSYRVPGFAGKIGFISSMTDHFCYSCNRIRITADGSLKVCLFGPYEVSLRDLMRSGSSDADVLASVGAALQRKHLKHAGMDALARTDNRPMILIGG